MASRLVNKRRLKAVILNFFFSGVAFASMIVGLVAGLVPSSKVRRYGNLTATDNPINYWVMIIGLFLIGVVFLGLALWSLKRYKSNENIY